MTLPPNRYPEAALKEGTLNAWSEDDYAILRYRSKVRTGGAYDVPSQLVIDFKESRPEAERLMLDLALAAIRRLEYELRVQRRCAYIVTLPSHAAGTSIGPCQRLARAIASRVDWLENLEPGLVRHTTVPKSATARPGWRPMSDQHKASIRYDGPVLTIPGQSIIMLDDVITAGETSSAGRALLTEATRCRMVVGFFLARTTYA